MPCGQNGPRRPVVHLAHRADRAGLDPLGELRRGLQARGAEHVRGRAGLARRLDDEPRLVEDVAERLVDDDVLPGLHRRERDRGVQVVRRHDVDGVEVLLLRQQLPEVGVGVAAPAGQSAVVPVHDLAADLAPAGAGLRPLGPRGVLQERADLVAQLEAEPLDVVLAPAVGVADRGDAQVRPLERGHELPKPLRAAADIGHVDAVAGGTCRGPPEAWRDDEGHGCGGALVSRKVRRLTDGGLGHGASSQRAI